MSTNGINPFQANSIPRWVSYWLKLIFVEKAVTDNMQDYEE